MSDECGDCGEPLDPKHYPDDCMDNLRRKLADAERVRDLALSVAREMCPPCMDAYCRSRSTYADDFCEISYCDEHVKGPEEDVMEELDCAPAIRELVKLGLLK